LTVNNRVVQVRIEFNNDAIQSHERELKFNIHVAAKNHFLRKKNPDSVYSSNYFYSCMDFLLTNYDDDGCERHSQFKI